jgi:tRNA(Ile2) C34 agmatinyltransferase TiaS
MIQAPRPMTEVEIAERIEAQFGVKPGLSHTQGICDECGEYVEMPWQWRIWRCRTCGTYERIQD